MIGGWLLGVCWVITWEIRKVVKYVDVGKMENPDNLENMESSEIWKAG